LGATASIEYRNKWLGHYYPLAKFGSRNLDARIRVIGLVDYSDVQTGSRYISRPEGSYWFRLGGEVDFDIGLFAYGDKTKQPITATVSYRFEDAVSGEGGYADLLKADLSFWLNPYTALSVDYQRGTTPVADKDINQLTVGIQIKY
jgi:hypothetical protein